MFGNNLLRITRAVAGDSVSAQMPVPASLGTGVQFAHGDRTQYALANGTRGFLLEHDVLDPVTYAAMILKDDVFMDNLVPPIKQGLEVTARKVEEAELEGDMGLVQTSGTGAISSATPVSEATTGTPTELGYINGLIALRQAGSELAGWLRGIQPVQNPANSVRILVEFAG